MPLERTDAIVIGRRPLGESDRLVSFYTRDFGRVTGVARAARRPRSRFGSALELLTLGHLVFFDTGRSALLRLDHFDIAHPFTRLREDLERLGHAAWMVECVARMTPEHDPQPPLYALLVRALRAAEGAERPGQIAIGFGIRCIALLGHHPRLDACLGCGRAYPFAPAYLDAFAGGLVCGSCEREAAAPLPISPAAIRAFERVAGGEPTSRSLGRTEAELAPLIDGYVSRLIGHPTRTPRFLREVRRLSDAPGGYRT